MKSEEKQQLRRMFSERRKSLSPEQRRSYDRAIRQNLCLVPDFLAAAAVAAFCPLGAEPDLLPCLNGKRLLLPRYSAESGVYELVEITDLERDLVTGHYGIAEPHPDLPASDRDFVNEEVLFLVPAVACGRDGTRLGRGGGFYDRMLESAAKPPVGVVYSCQIAEVLPRGRHDVPMKWVVTESEVLNCWSEGCSLSDKE